MENVGRRMVEIAEVVVRRRLSTKDIQITKDIHTTIYSKFSTGTRDAEEMLGMGDSEATCQPVPTTPLPALLTSYLP